MGRGYARAGRGQCSSRTRTMATRFQTTIWLRPASRSAQWLKIYSTRASTPSRKSTRSEEHTSELQSHLNLVCRLLLEKKKTPRQIDDTKDLVSAATHS